MGLKINLDSLKPKSESAKETSGASEKKDKSSGGSGVKSEESASIFDEKKDAKTLYDENFEYLYMHNQETLFESTGNTHDDIAQLNKIGQKRNEEDQDLIHGMSEREYDEYQAYMYYTYGIEVENQSVGNFQSVAVSVERMIDKQLTDEIANSYDSALDLVLDVKLLSAMDEIFGEGSMPNWGQLYGSRDRLLRDYGILMDEVESVGGTHKTYSFSLVAADENGNFKVIKDENGNLAQTIKTDQMCPDGLAQRNEIVASGMLDMMGYDCVSMLDYSAEEMEQIRQLATLNNSELGELSNASGDGDWIREHVIKARMKRDADGHIIRSDASAWLNGSYTNVEGQTTGRRSYWNEFYNKRDSGYYSHRTNAVTGKDVQWINRTITRNVFAEYDATGVFRGGSGPGVSYKGGTYIGNTDVLYSSSGSGSSSGSYFETDGELNEMLSEGKIKISRTEFENMVKEYVEQGMSRYKAESEVSEKYEVI